MTYNSPARAHYLELTRQRRLIAMVEADVMQRVTWQAQPGLDPQVLDPYGDRFRHSFAPSTESRP